MRKPSEGRIQKISRLEGMFFLAFIWMIVLNSRHVRRYIGQSQSCDNSWERLPFFQSQSPAMDHLNMQSIQPSSFSLTSSPEGLSSSREEPSISPLSDKEFPLPINEISPRMKQRSFALLTPSVLIARIKNESPPPLPSSNPSSSTKRNFDRTLSAFKRYMHQFDGLMSEGEIRSNPNLKSAIDWIKNQSEDPTFPPFNIQSDEDILTRIFRSSWRIDPQKLKEETQEITSARIPEDFWREDFNESAVGFSADLNLPKKTDFKASNSQ